MDFPHFTISLIILFIGINNKKVSSTDYSGCPPSFLKYDNEICIGKTAVATTLDQALTKCRALIGDYPGDVDFLITRETAVNDWLNVASRGFTGTEYWIGLFDNVTEGHFYWSDGVGMGWHKWKPGHPHEVAPTNEKVCVKMKATLWEAKKCTDTLEPFCQYTMADGADTCPAGFSRLTNTLMCYTRISGKKNFAEARVNCQNEGAGKQGVADIADVHNETIWSFFETNYASPEGWIGLRDDVVDNYKWLNNKTLEYPPWIAKLSAQLHDNEDCFVWKDGDWMDKHCTETRQSLCNYTMVKGMPFYNVGSSQCQIPSVVSTYPKFKQIADSDLTTCDIVQAGSVLVQPTNAVFRQPNIVVVANSSCSPSFGLSVMVEPGCTTSQNCPAVQCFPGIAEPVVIQGNQLYRCSYDCKDVTRIEIAKIIIRAELAIKLCDVSLVY